MNRKKAREFMMQTLFQMEACNDFDVNNLENYLGDKVNKAQSPYCEELFSLICNKKENIDQMVDRYSIGWPSQRMPKTDLAILRLAIGELLFMPDIPNAVSINEAVELAKKYGTDESSGYVNGILGKVNKGGSIDE